MLLVDTSSYPNRQIETEGRRAGPTVGLSSQARHQLMVPLHQDQGEKYRLSRPTIKADQIPVCAPLLQTHFLKPLINTKGPLTLADLAEFRKQIDLHIPIGPRGAVIASHGETHTSAWTRDMAAIGIGFQRCGQIEKATKIGECLYKAYTNPNQRAILNDYLRIGHNYGWVFNKYWGKDPVMNVPGTKFNISHDGDLVNYDKEWGMHQLDAFGYTLQLVGNLAKAGKLNFKELDQSTNQQQSESTVVALVRFLQSVRCWNQVDFGAWENKAETARASSVAAVISGLVTIREYFAENGFNEEKTFKVQNSFGYNVGQFMHDLDSTIKNCKETLNRRIALDGSFVRETDSRELDVALLFILCISDPKRIGLNYLQQKAILDSVYQLMGEVGFARFKYDEYNGMNWVTNPRHSWNPQGEYADTSVPNYRAAEWAMVDPYMAVLNYRLFIESEGRDFESLFNADMHLRRAMTQVTSDEHSYLRPNKDNMQIKIPRGQILESSWRSTGPETIHYRGPFKRMRQVWAAGENYGLNWTKIAIEQALNAAEEAYKHLNLDIINKHRKKDHELSVVE